MHSGCDQFFIAIINVTGQSTNSKVDINERLIQGSQLKPTASDTEEDYSPLDKDVRLTLLEEVILVGIKDKEVG